MGEMATSINSQSRMISSGAILAGNQVFMQILRFGRNVILARLLSTSDFGISATFWMTTAFLAAISQLGFEQMLIRDKDGDSDEVGATGQTLIFLRGLGIGFIIFVFAEPIMSMFGSPEAAGAFRIIAFSTILTSLAHRDTIRLQRDYRFGPSVLAQLIPDLLVTIAAWPLALWYRDYRAFVAFAVIQAVLNLLCTHLVAERKFRLGWNKQVAQRYLQFGWPLLLNGVLIFTAMQGDRVLLAKCYTMAELGVYSVAVGLALTPSGMLMQLCNQLMLPGLAKVASDTTRLNQDIRLHTALTGACAAAMGIFFIAFGPLCIDLLYGQKYSMASNFIGWLGVGQGIRLLRSAPTTASLALGDSKNSLYSNIFRQLGLGMAAVAAIYSANLGWIAACGAGGELLALCFAVARARSIQGFPFMFQIEIVLYTMVSFAIAMCIATVHSRDSVWIYLLIGGGFNLAAFTFILFRCERWYSFIKTRSIAVTSMLARRPQ